MSDKRVINPSELVPPRGFSHGILVSGPGRLLFLAGQDGSDREGKIASPGDLVAQYEQVIKNLKAVVEAAGGRLTNIVKLNIFVTDRAAYLAHLRELGKIHRTYFGDHYPAMAFFEVKSLFNNEALIEMEGVAHLSEEAPLQP